MKMKKRLLSILLSLMLMLGLVPGMGLTVYAAEQKVTFTAGGTENGITVSPTFYKFEAFFVNNKGNKVSISSENYNITKLVLTDKKLYSGQWGDSYLGASAGNVSFSGDTMTVTGINAKTVTIQGNNSKYATISSIDVYYDVPDGYSVTINPGSNMTKTDGSGAASQTGLSGAMTDVVYTADEGYYFPTDYSVDDVNGITVTRDSYTQITVSGTPTADAAITLTAPTAKTTPAAPTTAAAVDCTTADNNDGKLTGVTAEMEYKKSDADSWTAGTGSDITGLVPGTYYVRVKATETTNASTNQELTIKGFISYTVTFKVVNGKWNEGEGDAATADKTVTLTGHDGDTLKLTADQIPAVGTKPNDTYKAGSWDVTPSADTEITEATTYTYTYAQKDTISQTVTFKVVNGKWDDDSTADKSVTLTGYEGDTLKLTADQIPAVGTKPNVAYKAGSWDVTPSTDTEITAATTYTYTYAAKEASVVTKAPEAKILTYNGQAQELITAGTATGGEMQYALGTEAEAKQPYTTSIPTETNAGTYTVWYKVVGDGNHNDCEPDYVEVKINPVDKTALKAAIKAAQDDYDSIKDDEKYSEIAADLYAAIEAAESVAENDNADETTVNNALTTINQAKAASEEAVANAFANEDVLKNNDTIIDSNNKVAIKKLLDQYDKLTDDQKDKVDKKIGRAGTKKLSDLEKALEVANKIDALGNPESIDVSKEKAITFARTAYELLSDSQKQLVSNDEIEKLKAAEARLAEVKAAAEARLAEVKAAAEAAAAEKAAAKEALSALINDAKGKKAEDYTTTSWSAVNLGDENTEGSAIKAANDVLTNENSTTDELKAATTALQTALDNLVTTKAGAKAVLDETIQTAQAKLAENPSPYTDDSVATLQKAVDAATEVENDPEATKKQYENATKAVDAAVSALKTKADAEKEAATDALTTLIDEAKGKKAADYTEASWIEANLGSETTEGSAIKAANDVLNNAESTKADIETATANLQAAIDKLVTTKAGAKNDLDAAIKAAQKQLDDNSDKYTEETAAALQTAIDAATEVLEDKEATKKQYENATIAVEKAFKALVTKADAEAEAEMVSANKAVADAKTVAGTANAAADAAVADEYASDADKTAIGTAIETLEAKIKAANELPETATAEQKNAAAKEIEDAVKALNEAVDTANVNSAAKKAEAEEAANAAAQLAAAKTYAIERLDDYSEAKAKADATEAEKTAYDKAVADGKDAINAAEDQEAVAEAFTQAKAAVDTALAKIDKDRADAEAAAQKMAEAGQAVADAKTVAETAKTAADEAAADEYVSGADKTAIGNAKATVEAKINAAKNLPETATAEAKNAAAKDIEDAVKALNAAVDTAVVNSAAAKAKAEEEATAAAQLAAAKNNAKERLEDVYDAKNQTDYRAAQQKELADAREDGYQAIDEVTTPAEAVEALAAAKEALNAVKTDAQLTKEEKEAADTKAALAFTKQIGEIPASDSVKLADKAAIEAAGKAYDALSADQKLKVDAATKKKLESAQAALKKLEDALANAKKAASAAMSKPVKVKAKTKGIKISWTTCKEADGYEVYVQYAGKKFKKVTRNIKKSTTGKTKVFKIGGKKLNRKKDIRVYVSAYKMIDGKKVILANSKVATLKAKRNSK